MRNYISYAITLFQEKGTSEIVLKATGRAINKTVMIAELIKRRIAGLHQNTSTGSIDITDTWEPLEEGLPLETTRHVSIITITLSKKVLDSTSIGYQPPIPAGQVKPLTEFEDSEGGNVNGGMIENMNGGYYGCRGYGGRGRGRARGGGYRGRGRGWYGGGNIQWDSGITMVMAHQDHCLPKLVDVDEGGEGLVGLVELKLSRPRCLINKQPPSFFCRMASKPVDVCSILCRSFFKKRKFF